MRSNAQTTITNRPSESLVKTEDDNLKIITSSAAKSTTRIGSWNVQSAASHAKQLLVTTTMSYHRLDIVGLQETHFSRCQDGEELPRGEKDEVYRVYSSPHQPDAGRTAPVGGVAIAIRSRFAGTAHIAVRRPAEHMMHRIIAVDIACKPPVTIVNAYAPTEEGDGAKAGEWGVKDEMYAQLARLIDGRPKGSVLLATGDFNARLAHHRLQSGVGRFTLGTPIANENGDRLVQMMEQYGLVAVNSWLRQPTRRLHTHASNLTGASGKKIKLQIDYIIGEKRWVSSWRRVAPTWHTHHVSDHALLVGDFRLRLTTKRLPPRPPKPDLRRLATDPRVQQEYAAAVAAAYNAGEMETYDDLAKAMTSAALDAAGRMPRRPCTWLSGHSINIAAERRHTARGSAERRRLSQKLQRQVKLDREAHTIKTAAELNLAARRGHMKEMHAAAKSYGRLPRAPAPPPITAEIADLGSRAVNYGRITVADASAITRAAACSRRRSTRIGGQEVHDCALRRPHSRGARSTGASRSACADSCKTSSMLIGRIV